MSTLFWVVLGAWCLVPRAWYQAQSTWHQGPGARHPVPGTKCPAHTMYLRHWGPASQLGQNSNHMWPESGPINWNGKHYHYIVKQQMIAAKWHTIVQHAMQFCESVANCAKPREFIQNVMVGMHAPSKWCVHWSTTVYQLARWRQMSWWKSQRQLISWWVSEAWACCFHLFNSRPRWKL